MKYLAAMLLLCVLGCENARIPGEPVKCKCQKCDAKPIVSKHPTCGCRCDRQAEFVSCGCWKCDCPEVTK